MQAVLNVKGTDLSVLSIHYSDTGKVQSVYAINEDKSNTCFVDKADSQYETRPHVAIENLEGALKHPEFESRIEEERNKLFHHLEQIQREEHNKLNDILIEMGEMEEEYPFEKLEEKLVSKQREYKLAQQRVFGIIDAIEEVKAFHEGCLIDVDDEAIEA
ncbi:hypothetical protein [Lysinibacillus pakistanensis]|uniref:Uncharacterized protein n=2 Tax=Lysinibacillus pakistanensis TaxID=759811 RepID=A0AAQ3IV45_9BACI|nr:hypothetical protein [Lysinibacillus pakistanensis]MDM5231445.1 hypothetical protein [Lysinibacillus pakistanensis]WHY45284.1 hypothetical protein QNH22_18475 [Lysinibacillus pakistanensis]WHY46992.1 hypothetical protein QNH22_01890 [Lysinibacillus pakistanensis]WHY50292.1 hypothetical protein QNH24_18440 [Lysinibacillus pakistanensis]WHY52004.1 hypothetical protein QNH24_01885 [Lysinibacillus pakistanensis]